MKIGIFVDELFTGGFQKVALEEAIELKKEGKDVYFYILKRSKESEYEKILNKNNIKIIYLSDRVPNYLNINFKFPLFAFFSLFHVTYPFILPNYFKEDLNLIISHGTYTCFSAIRIAKKKNIKIINFVHDPVQFILEQKYNKNFIKRTIFKILSKFGWIADRYILKNSDSIVAFPEMIEFLKEKHNIYVNYHIISNGVELGKKCNKKQNYVIAFTKWDQGKNVEFLIEIWKNLAKKIQLKIIGKWAKESEMNEFIKKISSNDLKEYISVEGQMTTDKTRKYLRNARFLVHPCREPFGMTIFEAAAEGTPCIMTDNSGVARFFNKSNSVRVKENSLKEYLEAINYLIKNSNKTIKLGNEAYKVAEKNSWKNHNKILLGAIK
ncbi:glycosyltransferase [Candidatus Pacearchaeota archaeon]|nr:glycosyltransferase [Candidatus Pacearchaeota archaeon]